jgi:hypothetical protein
MQCTDLQLSLTCLASLLLLSVLLPVLLLCAHALQGEHPADDPGQHEHHGPNRMVSVPLK